MSDYDPLDHLESMVDDMETSEEVEPDAEPVDRPGASPGDPEPDES